MAAPSHPAVLPPGSGKAIALVPGGGGQIQSIPVLQNTPQPSVTMVRVVTHPLTSLPLNGYSAASLGGAEGNGDFRGTECRVFIQNATSSFFSNVSYSVLQYCLFKFLAVFFCLRSEQKRNRTESE